MTLHKIDDGSGQVGWRWGDDGTTFYGRHAKRMALREGAELDPRVFAQLEHKYGFVMAGEDVNWDDAVPSTTTEVINLD